MYISLCDLFWAVIGLVGVIALIYFIITLSKIRKLVANINDLLSENSKDITKLCKDLPIVTRNAIDISDNLKDVSAVVTEATANAIVTKDSLVNNIDTIKDILSIILSVFSKK
jgi:ABC-type transporter Mla subunit MlaD